MSSHCTAPSTRLALTLCALLALLAACVSAPVMSTAQRLPDDVLARIPRPANPQDPALQKRWAALYQQELDKDLRRIDPQSKGDCGIKSCESIARNNAFFTVPNTLYAEAARKPPMDHDQLQASDDLFLFSWWRALENVNTTLFVEGLFAAGNGYFYFTGRQARSNDFLWAMTRYGETTDTPRFAMEGHTHLSTYAYAIGNTAQFEFHAQKALALAPDLLDPQRALDEVMKGTDMPLWIRMLGKVMPDTGSRFVYPYLGTLLRNLAASGRHDLIRDFVAKVRATPMDRTNAMDIAIVLGTIAEHAEARVFLAKARAEWADTVKRIQKIMGEDLRDYNEAQLALTGVLLDYHAGKRPDPWPDIVRLRARILSSSAKMARQRPPGDDLDADAAALRQAFGITAPVQGMAAHIRALYADQGFSLDVVPTLVPLIRALENRRGDDLALALYAVSMAKLEAARSKDAIKERTQIYDTTRSRIIAHGLLRTLLARNAPGDMERAVTVSELTRSRQLKDLLGRGAPGRVASLSKPLALAAQLKARLSTGQAAVAYHLMDEGLLTLIVTREGVQARLTPLDTGALGQDIAALHDAMAENAEHRVHLAAVSKTLLEPLGDLPLRKNSLYFLPDGALHTVPFEALRLPTGRTLLEQCVVAYLPGMEWLLKPGQRRAPQTRLFAVADPVFSATREFGPFDEKTFRALSRRPDGPAFDPLPETRDEVQAIAKLFPAGRSTILVGPAADKAAVLRTDLSSYSHVHIATHSVLPGELPTVNEPSLVLSGGADQAGLLTVSEAQDLSLDAAVSVLSACNTGSGRIYGGEGVMGMSRAFLSAGSRAVVVSLWPVETEATRDLMIAFYRHMSAGKSQAQALRQAKLDFLRGGGAAGRRSPMFWAPFIIVGTGE